MNTIEGTATDVPDTDRVDTKNYRTFTKLSPKLATLARLGVVALVGVGFCASYTLLSSSSDTYPVQYTADPTTPEGTYALGRPGHRFSVECGYSSKMCTMVVDDGNTQSKSTFPYVAQEWFNPKGDNGPYHSIKEINNLPSFTGNPELKMTSDITANNRVLDILAQNGWIRTVEVDQGSAK